MKQPTQITSASSNPYRRPTQIDVQAKILYQDQRKLDVLQQKKLEALSKSTFTQRATAWDQDDWSTLLVGLRKHGLNLGLIQQKYFPERPKQTLYIKVQRYFKMRD